MARSLHIYMVWLQLFQKPLLPVYPQHNTTDQRATVNAAVEAFLPARGSDFTHLQEGTCADTSYLLKDRKGNAATC